MIKTVTVAFGDGIGPEIMDSTLEILNSSGVKLKFNTIEVGKKIYEKGFNSGLMPSAWESINETRTILKAPITTPQGGGYKSLNVTLRKKLGLFANVRPVSSFHPFVQCNFPKMDVVIIRENEEDLYAGIEYRQTAETFECLKLVTKKGCEKIIRYAFEYAVANSRQKVTCFSKDNIMKMTDGLFHKTFDEIALQYPQIKTDHYIIDIGCARLASKPEIFDVIVTMNLYGDIISDIVAEISGSVGLAGSANIGSNYAMFEAIHGSAPDIANQNIANPTGLIQASVMMLNHINESHYANLIRDALYKTIEDGVHTADIFNASNSIKKVGTKEFTKYVIENLGKQPHKLPIASYKNQEKTDSNSPIKQPAQPIKNPLISKKLIGFDLYIDWHKNIEDLLNLLKSLESEKFELKMISAKGLLLFPIIDKNSMPEYNGDLTSLRFVGKGICGKTSSEIINPNISVSNADIVEFMNYLVSKNLDIGTNDLDKIDFVKYEGLYLFNDKVAFTSGQGE